MTNEKESLTGKIIVFLDGETLFSVNGNIQSWKSKEKISIPRKLPIQTEINDGVDEIPPPLKTIDSKIVAKIEMRNRHDEEILCILCYELLESTRNQIVQDIVKIKQELLA